MTNKIAVAFLLSFTISCHIKAQGTHETEDGHYQDEKVESSMWGQVEGKRLPYFYVTNEDFEYPEEALKNRIQGQVDILFQINKDGSIIDSTIQVLKGLSKELDKAAIKIVMDSKTRRSWFINPNNNYFVSLVFRITEENWANYYHSMGLKEFRNKNYEEAIKKIKLSISFDDKEAKYFYSLYSVYSEIGNAEKACSNLRKAKKLNIGFKAEWKSVCK